MGGAGNGSDGAAVTTAETILNDSKQKGSDETMAMNGGASPVSAMAVTGDDDNDNGSVDVDDSEAAPTETKGGNTYTNEEWSMLTRDQKQRIFNAKRKRKRSKADATAHKERTHNGRSRTGC